MDAEGSVRTNLALEPCASITSSSLFRTATSECIWFWESTIGFYWRLLLLITSICFHVLPFLLASIIPLWTPTRCHLSNFTAGHIWQVKNPHDFFTGRCSQLVCLLLWSESEGFSLHPSVLFYLRIYKVFELFRVSNWKLTIGIARFFFLFLSFWLEMVS